MHGTSAIRALFFRALRSAFRWRLALDPWLGSRFLLDHAFAVARENLGIGDGLRRILLGEEPPVPAVDVARFDVPQRRRLIAARVLRHAHAQRARSSLHRRAGARRGARPARGRRVRKAAVSEHYPDFRRVDLQLFGCDLGKDRVGAGAEVLGAAANLNVPIRVHQRLRARGTEVGRIGGRGHAHANRPAAFAHRARTRIAPRPTE